MKTKKISKINFIILCALLIVLPVITVILVSCSENQQQQAQTQKPTFEVNQNFEIAHYKDGVKIIDFYTKNSCIYAQLDDTSSYFVCEIPDKYTIANIELEISSMLKKYQNIYLSEFLDKFKELEYN
jgi:uncharacterized protein YpmS